MYKCALYYYLLYPYFCIWILDLNVHPKPRGGWEEGAALFVPQLSPVLSCQACSKDIRSSSNHLKDGNKKHIKWKKY